MSKGSDVDHEKSVNEFIADSKGLGEHALLGDVYCRSWKFGKHEDLCGDEAPWVNQEFIVTYHNPGTFDLYGYFDGMTVTKNAYPGEGLLGRLKWLATLPVDKMVEISDAKKKYDPVATSNALWEEILDRAYTDEKFHSELVREWLDEGKVGDRPERDGDSVELFQELSDLMFVRWGRETFTKGGYDGTPAERHQRRKKLRSELLNRCCDHQDACHAIATDVLGYSFSEAYEKFPKRSYSKRDLAKAAALRFAAQQILKEEAVFGYRRKWG